MTKIFEYCPNCGEHYSYSGHVPFVVGDICERCLQRIKDEKRAIVIMNENHSMMDEQKRILNEKYDSYRTFVSPAEGWTLEQMKEVAKTLHHEATNEELDIVFISPVPYLLKELAIMSQGVDTHEAYNRYNVLVFHNDKREKKELSNGKIIQVVAQTGWQLV